MVDAGEAVLSKRVEKTALLIGVDPMEIEHLADFSPGPWLGFNGVISLVVARDTLFAIRRRLINSDEVILRAKLSTVRVVRFALKPRHLRVDIFLSAHGTRLKLTTPFDEGRELIERISSSAGT